jgi:hypothetical protein
MMERDNQKTLAAAGRSIESERITAQEVHDAFARYDRPDARFRFGITPRP